MPKIISIEETNFKGNTCKDQLTGKDMFLGSNGIGKSSRIQSILFSILGYIPEQGKSLASTYQFASDDLMSAKICTDAQLEIERSIHKKMSKGEEKLEEKISITPALKEKTLAKKKERILSEIGDFPVMLNFQEFIDKTDSQKREFIYSLTGSSCCWDKERILKYLKAKLLTKEITKDDSLIAEATHFLDELITKFPNKGDTETAIQILIDWVDKKHIYWKEEISNTDGTIKKLSEFKNEDSSIGTLANTKTQLDKLQLQIIEEEKKLAVVKNTSASITAKKSKISTTQSEVAALKKQLNGSPAELLGKIKSEIGTLNKKIISKKYVDDINRISAQITEARKQQGEKSKHKDEVLTQGTQKKGYIESTEKMLEQIKNHKGTCVINCNIACNKDFSKFIDFSNKDVQNKSIEKDKLLEEYYMLKKELQEIENTINSLEKRKEALLAEERRSYNSNNSIQKKITELNQKYHNIELSSEKLKLKTIELNSLKSEFKDAVLPENQSEEKLQQNITQLKIKHVNLKELVKKQEKTKNNMENLKKTQIQNKKANNLIIITDKLKKALGPKGLQGEIIKENLEPLENAINENFRILGIDHKFFFECESSKGKEVFQFGWIDKKRNKNRNGKVNFNTLSDGQKAIFLIAFLVSIIEKKNPKIRILAVDKIEAIDEVNLLNLIKGLKKLENKLDNIIVCGRLLDKKLLKVAENEGFKVNNLDDIQNKNPDFPLEEAI